MSDGIKQIRVLAADDHPMLRQGIAGLIADERMHDFIVQALMIAPRLQ